MRTYRLSKVCRFGRRWLSYLITLFATVGLFSQVLGDDEESKQSRLPHPWLQDAPPNIARLIDIGNVAINVDDEMVREKMKAALTVFQFHSEYRMRFWTRTAPDDSDGNRAVRIHAKLLEPTVQLRHRVIIPSTYRPTVPWQSPLLLHEFDHVAISSDPRLIAILKELDNELPPWNQLIDEEDSTFEPNSFGRPSDAWLVDKIQRKVNLRMDEVNRIVNQYYKRLDQQSRDGLESLTDRNEFFMKLYSIEDLESAKFEFTKQVRGVLSKVQPSTVQQHYNLSE